MTTISAVLRASDAKRLLSALIPFASKDATLPVLNAVRLTANSKDLIVEGQATDRYGLARQRVHPLQVAGKTGAASSVVGLKVLKTIVAALKPTKANDFEVTFAVEDGAGARFVWTDPFDNASFAVNTSNVGDYPNVERIFADNMDKPTASVEFNVDPARLLQFRPAISANKPGYMHLRATAANKPLVVTIGDDFQGLLMPIFSRED